MTSQHDGVFSGYLVVADDMVILPERIKNFDKTLIWIPPMEIADILTGKYSNRLLNFAGAVLTFMFLFNGFRNLTLVCQSRILLLNLSDIICNCPIAPSLQS